MISKNIVSIDIEADGPCPGEYSMISFGAVIVERELNRTFYGQLAPISTKWIPEALAVSGHTRDETMDFKEPVEVMELFKLWLSNNTDSRPRFFCDNPGFDFGFMNYYFHKFTGSNPFGWSAFDISRFYKGVKHDIRARIGKLRKTKHTHHPVDDAKGNAEALIHIADNFNIKGLKF